MFANHFDQQPSSYSELSPIIIFYLISWLLVKTIVASGFGRPEISNVLPDERVREYKRNGSWAYIEHKST